MIARGKPLTLAVEPVTGTDSKADAVERVLDRVGTYPFELDHILIDRAAYVGEVIGVLRRTAPPVFPVKTGKASLRGKLSTSASYMTEETTCEGKEHEQTFPLAVHLTYQNGDRGKHGVKATGYAAYGLEDRTPQQVAHLYSKRAAIEKSYEKFREARALTTTPSRVIRLFYVGVGFLLVQLWVVLLWGVLARPRRGERSPLTSRSVMGSSTGSSSDWTTTSGGERHTERTVSDYRQGTEPASVGRLASAKRSYSPAIALGSEHRHRRHLLGT